MVSFEWPIIQSNVYISISSSLNHCSAKHNIKMIISRSNVRLKTARCKQLERLCNVKLRLNTLSIHVEKLQYGFDLNS